MEKEMSGDMDKGMMRRRRDGHGMDKEMMSGDKDMSGDMSGDMMKDMDFDMTKSKKKMQAFMSKCMNACADKMIVEMMCGADYMDKMDKDDMSGMNNMDDMEKDMRRRRSMDKDGMEGSGMDKDMSGSGKQGKCNDCAAKCMNDKAMMMMKGSGSGSGMEMDDMEKEPETQRKRREMYDEDGYDMAKGEGENMEDGYGDKDGKPGKHWDITGDWNLGNCIATCSEDDM